MQDVIRHWLPDISSKNKVPNRDLYVVVLFNFRGKLPELLAQDIVAIALGKPFLRVPSGQFRKRMEYSPLKRKAADGGNLFLTQKTSFTYPIHLHWDKLKETKEKTLLDF